MWQCEDSHGSTRAEIAALLGQSFPVRVSTGKKQTPKLMILELSHTVASRDGLKAVCISNQFRMASTPKVWPDVLLCL